MRASARVDRYLPDQLLVKMDRATMLNSIEGRAPFLDRALSAFAFGVAPQLKVHGWTTERTPVARTAQAPRADRRVAQ